MEEEPQSSSLSQLIVSLEQATFMAKQLSSSSSTNPIHLNQIHTSLHQAHHQLTAFLSTLQPPPAAENSVSSANGAAPMQLGDDGDDVDGDNEDEETSKCTIDRVEEKLRECFIKNKRPKRPLSPSVVAQGDNRRLSTDDGFVKDYDPHSSKMKKALDLVYQFHG
ncbi:uncharacterized protein LOC131609563 [Vicia villosa]|uniref:uncharacterized protein LOC131609563 n=1 Tax=Vicia villosa TaxID=3911 RepID=UPI00273C0A4C|nr:uncharacterized protein LOC131609563 [Vicia villosa]